MADDFFLLRCGASSRERLVGNETIFSDGNLWVVSNFCCRDDLIFWDGGGGANISRAVKLIFFEVITKISLFKNSKLGILKILIFGILTFDEELLMTSGNRCH